MSLTKLTCPVTFRLSSTINEYFIDPPSHILSRKSKWTISNLLIFNVFIEHTH